MLDNLECNESNAVLAIDVGIIAILSTMGPEMRRPPDPPRAESKSRGRYLRTDVWIRSGQVQSISQEEVCGSID